MSSVAYQPISKEDAEAECWWIAMHILSECYESEGEFHQLARRYDMLKWRISREDY